jgi:hypothetical protein
VVLLRYPVKADNKLLGDRENPVNQSTNPRGSW